MDNSIKENEERTFRIKHNDFCIIVFPNGDIDSPSPYQLWLALRIFMDDETVRNTAQSKYGTAQ